MFVSLGRERKFAFLLCNYIDNFICVLQCFYYNGGYSISSIYTVPSKNQMGPLMGAGFIIAYIKLTKVVGLIIKKFIYFFVLALIAGSLITIRNRTGILGIIIVILFNMIINLKTKFYT